MILRAIEGLRDRSGSSAIAISKWIRDRYPVHETKYKSLVSAALKAATGSGKLVKVKASFKLSAKELRRRQNVAQKEKRQKRDEGKRSTDGPLDDLEVAAWMRDRGQPPPPLPFPDLALVLSPPAAAGDVLSVAEFCRAFDEALFCSSPKYRRRKRRFAVSVLDLDAALSVLPLEHDELELPPLLERLALALLRIVCGRDVCDGSPTDREHFLGHAQNRSVWGHSLNAVTWPDILRRHLAAERRFRHRVRDACPLVDPGVPLFHASSKHSTRLVPWASAASPPEISPPKKSSKRPTSKRCARTFPFDPTPLRGDDDTLAEALLAYCDDGQAFGELRPELCAALLRALVDDALQTPAVQRTLRDCEAVFEARTRQHRAAFQAKKRIERAVQTCGGSASAASDVAGNDKDSLKGKSKKELEAMLEEAKGELDVATKSLREASTTTHCLRREPLGSDRYHSYYWRLSSLDETVTISRDDPGGTSGVGPKQCRLRRIAVRLHACDERFESVYSPWCCFGASDITLPDSLDDRGRREAKLARAIAHEQSLMPGAASSEIKAKAAHDERVRVANAARDRLAVVLARPPPRKSSAACLPWPGPLPKSTALAALASDDAVEDDDDDEDDEVPRSASEAEAMPRRSSRIVVMRAVTASLADLQASEKREAQLRAEARATKKKESLYDDDDPPARHEESEDDVARRAQAAFDLAAPWRWPHATLAIGIEALRHDLDDILVRLEALANADDAPAATQSNEPQQPFSVRDALRALCSDTLKAEATMTSLLTPHDADDTQPLQDPTGADDGADDRPEEADVDWIERDRLSEDDYYELIGACSDVPSWRSLWRNAVGSCQEGPASLESSAARFATLFGALAQAVERHTPPLEARAKVAARLLLENTPTPKQQHALTPAVFVPSEPTDVIVWARVRGYPWWPARQYRPIGHSFQQALEARQATLVVFVSETAQYLLDQSCLAPFTGDAEDPHMPKNAKSTTKGLATALKLARTAYERCKQEPAH